MNINEMTFDEIQTRLAEIEMRKADLSASLETAENLEEIEQEVDALNTEKRQLLERETAINEAYEARQKEIAAVLETGKEKQSFEERKTMTNLEVRNTKEYIDAFAEYIKSEDDKECRALLTENVSGMVPVPEFVDDLVRTAWEREGITARVRKTYLKGNLKVSFEAASSEAVEHTEAANSAVSEEELYLGTVNLIPKSIKKWISISDEVYDLRGEAFLRYIYDELTYRIAKKLADAIIADIEACVEVTTSTCPGVPVVESDTVTLGLVAQAMAKLSDEASNPVIIMNKATWGAFKAAQAAGYYAYDPFEGLPVVFNNSITAYSAATTGVTYAIVGDLGIGAQVNFPNGDGIDIKFDDMTLMEKDLIKILGRQYAAHGVVAPDAFVKITKVAE